MIRLPPNLAIVLTILALFFTAECQADQFRIVGRVVDGDILLLANGERVRLIGVDTPEMHESEKLHADAERSRRDIETIQELGRRASEFTRRMVEGKKVRLEYDQANSNIRHKDEYGRTLAYVYLEDGTFLNAEIIRQGYGYACAKYPFRYMELFMRYEVEAREDGRGLWAD
jgi:micrococcal nuclease